MAALPILQEIALPRPLDEVFGQRVRLAIMASVVAASDVSFVQLKQSLTLTDGNLSSHLAFLEKRGLVQVTKSFEGKKPLTRVSATEQGRAALADYLASLEELIASLKTAKVTP